MPTRETERSVSTPNEDISSIKDEMAEVRKQLREINEKQTDQARKHTELTFETRRTNEILMEIKGAFVSSSDIKHLDSRVKTLEDNAKGYVSEDRVANMEKGIAGLENWQDWALKLVVGAVIMALLGLVIISGGGA